MTVCIPVIKDNGNSDLINNDPIILESAESAILMEVETNQVLYEYNAHEKRSPASMTKIMTMKLVLDAVDNNEMKMNEEVTTSEHAASMGGSQIFLSVGEKMTVDDLFKSMVIASANDAAVALSERVSGSEENFVKKMNYTAKQLGCKNTNFSNSTGLPVENHYTTCYDMALISSELLKKYEDKVIVYSSMYESYIRTNTPNPFWLVNTNKMLKNNSGVDGLKTGWTNEAGYCITTTMEKNGMRLVCVVMGAKTPTLRNSDAMKILNYGFNVYDLLVIKEKNSIIKTESNILLEPNNYNIVTSENISIVKYKGQVFDNITYDVELYHDKIRKLENKNIGVLKVYADGKFIKEVSLDLEEVPKKSNFFDILFTVFKSLF